MPDAVELPIMAYPAGVSYNVPALRSLLTSNAVDAHCGAVCVACLLAAGLTLDQVPELVGKGTLLLDLPTLADVMLGTVDNWNHSAIRALNPTLAHLLPNQPIVVVTPLGSSIAMQSLTEALSGSSAEFKQLVCSPFSLYVCVCVWCVVCVCACIKTDRCAGGRWVWGPTCACPSTLLVATSTRRTRRL
jgi:hypothetical protein